MPSIPYSDEELEGLRNVSDVTRNNSMLRRLLSTVDQAREELSEARGLVWQGWECAAKLQEDYKSLINQWYKDHSDLSKVLCEGAFKIERDPMELQGVFYALQDGIITTGWARDAVRRWLAGLPIPDLDKTPVPESATAQMDKAKEELAQAQKQQLALEQERDALSLKLQSVNDQIEKLANAVHNYMEAEGGPAHIQGYMSVELLAVLPPKKGANP